MFGINIQQGEAAIFNEIRLSFFYALIATAKQAAANKQLIKEAKQANKFN